MKSQPQDRKRSGVRPPSPRDLVNATMGWSLRLLNRFAGSDFAERFGLLGPSQKILYRGTRSGMQAAAAMASTFGKKPAKAKPERLARPARPRLFDLTLTDEQELTHETMRRFAESAIRPAAEEADSAAQPPPELLGQIHELGINLLAIPESFEGAGEERSPVSQVLIAEDLAYGDMGIAFAALAPASVIHALVNWGNAEQQARYLPAFADETFIPAALALLEPQPLFDPGKLRTGAVRDGEGYRLVGEKCAVPLGDKAHLFLVAAEVLGLGPRLFLVEPGAEGLWVEPDPSMGLRSAGLCRLHLDNVRVDRSAVLGEDGRAGFDYDGLVDRARIAWAAMTVGTCQAMLDYVIPYCNERKAFGEPITNRQSVAFMIADMATEIEAMRLMVYRAASRAEHGLGFRREAVLAFNHCARYGSQIATDGVQLLGGHGYVKDHPVELWYRHLCGVAVMDGGLNI